MTNQSDSRLDDIRKNKRTGSIQSDGEGQHMEANFTNVESSNEKPQHQDENRTTEEPMLKRRARIRDNKNSSGTSELIFESEDLNSTPAKLGGTE